jgi:hypothetical protein
VRLGWAVENGILRGNCRIGRGREDKYGNHSFSKVPPFLVRLKGEVGFLAKKTIKNVKWGPLLLVRFLLFFFFFSLKNVSGPGRTFEEGGELEFETFANLATCKRYYYYYYYYFIFSFYLKIAFKI